MANAGSRNPRAVAVASLDISLEFHGQEEDEGLCYDDDLWDDWYDDSDAWWYRRAVPEPIELEEDLGSCYFDDEVREYESCEDDDDDPYLP